MKLSNILNSFKAEPVSIDLPDDGQRFVSRGVTKRGGYPVVNLSNPQVIADTLFYKSLRSQIKETNIQRFT